MEKIKELLQTTLNSDWLMSFNEKCLNKVQLNFILNNTLIGKSTLGDIGVAPINMLGGGLRVVIKTTDIKDLEKFLDDFFYGDIRLQDIFQDETFSRFQNLYKSGVLEICEVDLLEENRVSYIVFDVLFEEDFIQTMDEFIEHIQTYSTQTENKEFIEFANQQKEQFYNINLFLEENNLTK